MPVHSIFGRAVLLSRVDVDALLDHAEEPRELLDRMVRDYTGTIGDAESAVALAVRGLRVIEADAREVQAAAARWGATAQAASGLADQLRGTGDDAGAETYDNLARAALGRQIDAEATARALAGAIADQHALTERLTEGLRMMDQRLERLRVRRGSLPPSASGGTPAPGFDVDVLDPAGDVVSFEDRVRRGQARLREGAGSAAAETLRIDIRSPHAEVEARLSRLKTTR
ncbi:MAG TPA: PspA/IM30 family protein [Micromonosporaceae bacterium]|nr:PspA/IM30 family protein [Micromonosporaceae bacterium]